MANFAKLNDHVDPSIRRTTTAAGIRYNGNGASVSIKATRRGLLVQTTNERINAYRRELPYSPRRAAWPTIVAGAFINSILGPSCF